ncbi:MAG: hypothetical protein R3245_11710, partial [Kiloniellales bacterium]|nr:hypothetical protein [Kiloniellales bacterium]
RLLGVEGKIQKEGIVIHLVAEKLFDMTGRLMSLTSAGKSDQLLDPPLAPADEVRYRGTPPKAPVSQGWQALRRHPRDMPQMPNSRDFK